MKKGPYIFNLAIILLLVASVIAAGSSTGATTNQASNTDSDPTTNFAIDQAREGTPIKASRTEKKRIREACEDTENRRERIKCRLQYIKDHKEEFDAGYNALPEACRKLEKDDRGRCVAFYKKSQACYEMKGIEKNKCFKRLANFAKANIRDEDSERGQKARDYAILLLYDIQEKIEQAIENDRVDADAGADAIDKIVEIKQDILDGKTKREITPKMLQLRTLLKNIKSTIDQDE